MQSLCYCWTQTNCQLYHVMRNASLIPDDTKNEYFSSEEDISETEDFEIKEIENGNLKVRQTF